MHPQDNRRFKKREKGGCVSFPPTHELRESDRCEALEAVNTEPPGEVHCIDSQGDPVHSGSGERGQPDVDTTDEGVKVKHGPGPPRDQRRADLRRVYETVVATGHYNYEGARFRVPSGLNIAAWKEYLADYTDGHLVQMLEFGWPVNFDRSAPLKSTLDNHASATLYEADIDHYIATELEHQALIGPFDGPTVAPTHVSPLMTKPKKDSPHRRVIMDLSWPDGASINDGVEAGTYLDAEAKITLPTVQYMEDRLLELGPGAWMYKTDLARGYRQLRVDPTDWPLLGLQHRGKFYLDMCPPFGLKTSALFMQRTSYVHGLHGYYSRPYLDDFGGAEGTRERADDALDELQDIMGKVGLVEATKKVCRPAQTMIWLGILFDSNKMTMRIPDGKMGEIGEVLDEWADRQRATQREMQQLLGLLQFVASVSPPARIFTNRMLENLREAPRRGTETLSLGFKRDLGFFRELWPAYNGVRIILKDTVQCQDELELDACLTGCGAYNGTQFYSEQFPEAIVREQHPIAHLELLNIVVAAKTWATEWAHHRVAVHCDNMNACLAVRSGRSRDPYIQGCVRELFMVSTTHDIELHVTHKPGATMRRADALSRAHTGPTFARRVAEDPQLCRARQVRIPRARFDIVNTM